MPRDNFTLAVIRILAARAGNKCSNPGCRRETSGPDSTSEGIVNLGVGAHITAAAPGGPRYDASLSSKERASAPNGIWLCQVCGKKVDDDDVGFPKAMLLEWKTAAEAHAKSLLEIPDRPQRRDAPILMLPTTDASVSQLPFSSRATTLVGRDAEHGSLKAFVDSDKKFAWWLITGPGGSGKSRLALELCHVLRPRWDAGFLSRVADPVEWSRYRPVQPTLIVIDYVVSRAGEASAVILQLGRGAAHFPHPVRVLLLEREEGSWWRGFLREDSDTESAELVATGHAKPLSLKPLTTRDLFAIASEISARTNAKPATADAFARVMRAIDPLGRPLFGMIAGQLLAEDRTDLASHATALRHGLRREFARWRQVIADNELRERFIQLVVLATFVGGLSARTDGFAFLRDSAQLLPDADLLDADDYSALIGAPASNEALPGLQPDILGERFVLDRLSDISTRASAKRMLATAWSLQRADVCAFVLRAAQDFSGDVGLEIALFAIPRDSADSRTRWSYLVGDVARVSNRTDDPLTQKLLAQVTVLARDHSDEIELQNALANAEFVLANIFQFTERRYGEAAAHYARALATASPGSDVAAAAINNRGIVNRLIEDDAAAFSDWTNVIDMDTASDEARACALNNRADVFAERGDHEAAIRDRTAVLAFAETSHDRRYIALARRSRSLVALERHDDAIRDLDLIQATGDISPHQKAEAQLDKAVLLRDQRRFDEARRDFEAVLQSDDVFPGTHADVLVELAEMSRLEGDVARAAEFIQSAEAAKDVADQTLVQVLVVRALLLEDKGDAGAQRVWEEVLAHPHSRTGQKEIAARHLMSIVTA